MAAEQMIKILLYFQPASFLFASRESSKEFLEVLEVDILQKLHKHIWGRGGNIHLVAHGQPYPFSAEKKISNKTEIGLCILELKI